RIASMSAQATNVPGLPLRTTPARARPARAASSRSASNKSSRAITPEVRMLTRLSGRSKMSQATPSPSTSSVSAACSTGTVRVIVIRSGHARRVPGGASEPRPDLRVLAGQLHDQRVAPGDLDRHVPVQLLVGQRVARVHPPPALGHLDPDRAARVRRIHELVAAQRLEQRRNDRVERCERLVLPGLALQPDLLELRRELLLDLVVPPERGLPPAVHRPLLCF